MAWAVSLGASASGHWRADWTVGSRWAKVRIPFFSTSTVLAKLTSKNQLTLPKAVTQAVGATEYFEVEARAGQIILTPVRIQRGDAVRAKLAELGVSSADIADAVAWARSPAASTLIAAEPAPPPYGAADAAPTPRAVKKPPARKSAARKPIAPKS